MKPDVSAGGVPVLLKFLVPRLMNSSPIPLNVPPSRKETIGGLFSFLQAAILPYNLVPPARIQ